MMKRRSWAVAGVLALVLSGCGGTGTTGGPASTSSGTTSAAPTATTTTSAPATTVTSPAAPESFGYVPLWPFASVAAAQAWQSSPSAAKEAWRLNARSVALAFTRTYLGFADIDRVLHERRDATGAHETVGYAIEGGRTGAAAVVHLVRIGSGANAPWEVVGTDDTKNFLVNQPRYGATVSGPVAVGGHISGVDESIKVTARQLHGVVGSYCCLPAGGGAAGQAWRVTVRLTRTTPGPVTLVASTGGHVSAVERFAITGARVKG